MSISALDKTQLKNVIKKSKNVTGKKKYTGNKDYVKSCRDKESKDVLNDNGQIDFDELSENLEELLNNISFNIMV